MNNAWEARIFSEIGSIFNGNSINESEKKTHFEGLSQGVPYIGTKDVSSNHEIEYESGVRIPDGKQKGFKLAPAKTIFVCAEGGSAGKKIALTDREVYFGNKLFAICPSPSFNNRFIFYYCLSNAFSSQFKNAMAGLIGGVSLNKFKDFRISLPPLSEQQRIVSILDEAFTGIATATANAEKNLANARELFESYLQSVFENKGEDWSEVALQDVVDAECTLSYGIVQPGEEFQNGLPVVRPTDLTNKFIYLKGLKLINPLLADGYKRTKLTGNELLLCVRGSTGIVSIASIELQGANVTRGIVPIRFNPSIIQQAFGYYLIVSNQTQKQIKSKTYGAALMQINIGDLRKITVPFPSLNSQQTIVAKLDELSNKTKRLESIYQQKLNALEELKKSILNQAFSGQLQ